MRCDYVTQPVVHGGSPFGEGHVRCGQRALALCIVTERLPSGTISDMYVHACGAHADALRHEAHRAGASYREEHLSDCT